jgi:hypothetical protein
MVEVVSFVLFVIDVVAFGVVIHTAYRFWRDHGTSAVIVGRHA